MPSCEGRGCCRYIWGLIESCCWTMLLDGSESPPCSAVAIFNRRTSAVNASFKAVTVEYNYQQIYQTCWRSKNK
jgi:hypothetical protein